MSENSLYRFQMDVAGYLRSHSQLRYVSITEVRPRSAAAAAGFQTKLDELLAGIAVRNGKRGVSVIVSMPGVDGVNENTRGVKGDMVLAIDVIENIVINNGPDGTGAPAEEHALTIVGLLQHQTFELGKPVVSDPQAIKPLQEELLNKKVVYRLTMRKRMAAANLEKVAMPSVSQEGNAITLTCATSGAAIYYTLDGSFPGPGNAEALLYAEPFEIEVGEHLLRAAAFKDDLAGSHVTEADVTGAA